MNKEPFIYASAPVHIPGFTSGQTTVPVTRDAAFYCEQIRVESMDDCSLLILDSDKNQWFNIPVLKNVINNWKPSIPKYTAPGSVIIIEIMNISTKSDEIRVAFCGYKDTDDKLMDLLK